MSFFLFVIHTCNAPHKVKRLINSAKKYVHGTFSILVVDDSHKKAAQQTVQTFLRKQTNMYYVNGTRWKELQSLLLHIPNSKNQKALLKELRLGINKWNTSHARTIGQLCAHLMGASSVLFLDDDMIFHSPFNLEKLKKYSFGGLHIDMSPDLSRIEWIQFYQRYKTGKANKKTYVDVLFHSLSETQQKQLFSMHADMLPKSKLNQKITFPTRNELSGGAYFSQRNLLSLSSFPPWFDEDWYLFQSVRKKKIPLTFLPYSIGHGAERKQVLNMKQLLFEEKGILAVLAMNYATKKVLKKHVEKALQFRKKHAEQIIYLLAKTPFDRTIKKSLFLMNQLKNYLDAQIPSKILKEIRAFQKLNKGWKPLLELLQKNINELNHIALSPHPDDIAFSLGGALASGKLPMQEIYTFFSTTNYTIKGHKNTQKITLLREKEEKQFAKFIGAKVTLCGLQDACLREYGERESSYLNKKNKPENDVLLKKVEHILKKIDKKNNVVYVPLGLGNHIDHRIVHKAAQKIRHAICIYYEDLPYTATKKNIDSVLKKRLKNYVPLILPMDVMSKKKLLQKIYPSQCDAEGLGIITVVAKKRKGERIWVPKRVVPLFAKGVLSI